jgi:hypothetical protein
MEYFLRFRNGALWFASSAYKHHPGYHYHSLTKETYSDAHVIATHVLMDNNTSRIRVDRQITQCVRHDPPYDKVRRHSGLMQHAQDVPMASQQRLKIKLKFEGSERPS